MQHHHYHNFRFTGIYLLFDIFKQYLKNIDSVNSVSITKKNKTAYHTQHDKIYMNDYTSSIGYSYGDGGNR